MKGQIYEELSQEPGESGVEDDDDDQFDKTKSLSKRLEKHRRRRWAIKDGAPRLLTESRELKFSNRKVMTY